MATHSRQACVLMVALLGLSFCGGVFSATAIARVSAVARDGASVSAAANAEASGTGTTVVNVAAKGKDGAKVDVVASGTADDNAVAIVDAVVAAAGDAELKAGAFANAIQKGDGKVVARALLRAKADGDELFGETTQAFALSVANAIGKGPENSATIANTVVSVIAEGGESRAAVGKSLSILIADKGCSPIQDVIQKAEAEASSSGKQQAFLETINVDVKLIKCAFPDTCGSDGVDKRGGCCGSKSDKCGACKDGRCDFRLIWNNPGPIWVCDAADCRAKKPCICG